MSFAKNGFDLEKYRKRAELAVEKIIRENPQLTPPPEGTNTPPKAPPPR